MKTVLTLTVLLAVAVPGGPAAAAEPAPKAGPAAASDRAPEGVPACPSGEEKPDVATLVERTEKLLQGSTQVATFTMDIQTKAWKRKLKLKTWAKGEDYALIRVLEGGPREVGMMTLKREDQLWNYLPQAGRVMKLPSGMLGDSWMGSDFTNDDLVRGSSLTDDFTSEVVGIEKVGERDAWRIRLTPKPETVVVWGRVEMLIDRQSCLPLQQVFFDEEGERVRTMEFGDFRKIGWREFPARMTIIPAEEERRTSLQYEEIEFDTTIPESTFGLHRLRQGR